MHHSPPAYFAHANWNVTDQERCELIRLRDQVGQSAWRKNQHQASRDREFLLGRSQYRQAPPAASLADALCGFQVGEGGSVVSFIDTRWPERQACSS
jgi:hypothetical protein